MTHNEDQLKICFTYSKEVHNKSYLIKRETNLLEQNEERKSIRGFHHLYQITTNQTIKKAQTLSLIKLPLTNKPGIIETTANDEFLIVYKFNNSL